MSYNCERCHDTGSLSKDIDGSLDCACCGVADERLALEKWALEEKLDVSVGALWRIREHVVGGRPAGAGAPSELVKKLDRVSRWIDKFPVPTDGATTMMCYLRDVSEFLARQGAAPAQAEPVALEESEQYRQQMAAISVAAHGYWKETESIHPDYDTVPLRDVAKLYAKYEALATAPAHAGVAQADDARDAARWRAFVGSARIKMQGSAGLTSETDPYGKPWNGYAHLGMEIWTTYSRDFDADMLASMDKSTALGREWLTKYADVARAAIQASSGEK